MLGHELDLSANFYEFMPQAETEQAQPVMAHELKPGCDYQVIVLGYSWMYRYYTNTLLRCDELTDSSVTVTKLCPRDYDIQSMEGITEEDVYRTVQMSARKTDIQVSDFVFILVLEPADIENNFERAEGMPQGQRDELAVKYGKLFGISRPIKIFFNEPGTHTLYAEMAQYHRKILQDAVRPCHIIDNALESRFFTKLAV